MKHKSLKHHRKISWYAIIITSIGKLGLSTSPNSSLSCSINLAVSWSSSVSPLLYYLYLWFYLYYQFLLLSSALFSTNYFVSGLSQLSQSRFPSTLHSYFPPLFFLTNSLHLLSIFRVDKFPKPYFNLNFVSILPLTFNLLLLLLLLHCILSHTLIR